MKLLILSFYFTPDLSAGSFRTTALVNKFKEKSIDQLEIDVLTTFPNRYTSYRASTKEFENWGDVNIYRFKIPEHKGGFFDQAISFSSYALSVMKFDKKRHYDAIFATSSRLLTATLGAYLSRRRKIPLYLDIRDIFYDTMKDILSKNPLKITLPVIKVIEKYTFLRSQNINLVSEGFKEYMLKINPEAKLSFFTNGIDEIFYNYDFSKSINKSKKIITYAGNIGKGQGLEHIIPEMGKFLGNEYEIRIIGDGGAKIKLEQELANINSHNVKIFSPVNREKLLKLYKESDYLFLHLNKHEAFKKVLPSKIFEYAVTGKRIIAGVEGYSKEFIQEYIPGSIIFEPMNINDFSKKFTNIREGKFNIEKFKNQFNRSSIMSNMVNNIINILPN